MVKNFDIVSWWHTPEFYWPVMQSRVEAAVTHVSLEQVGCGGRIQAYILTVGTRKFPLRLLSRYLFTYLSGLGNCLATRQAQSQYGRNLLAKSMSRRIRSTRDWMWLASLPGNKSCTL